MSDEHWAGEEVSMRESLSILEEARVGFDAVSRAFGEKVDSVRARLGHRHLSRLRWLADMCRDEVS